MNTEKYITFSVPIKKELDNSRISTYKLKFTGSYRFTLTLSSNLVDNLSEIYGKKNVEIKTGNLSVNSKTLKINFLLIAKSVEKTVKTNKWINEKVFKYIQILQ